MTIILEDIGKNYGPQKALEHFNVEIEWGRCYAFVGPDGSGKSTILKIFMGTEKPDSGKVSRMGDYKYPTLHSAYIPQKGSLNLKKDAIWNVKKAHRWANKAGAIKELSNFLPMEKLTIPTSELSLAERGFVEIVKAFFVPADFIVFDEPFEDMDQTQKKEAIAYTLQKRGSRPLLITSKTDDAMDFAKIIHLNY